MQVVEDLTAQEIGGLYRAHRVTVARWLGATREQLMTALNQALEARGALSSGDARRLLALVSSQPDLSLDRVLEKMTEEAG